MLFYAWEDASVWDHGNQSFHLHSDLGPVSCFHLRTFLMAHRGEWLQSDGAYGRGSLLPDCPQGSLAHHPWWL